VVRRWGLAALLCASCAGPVAPLVDTARLPPGAFGAGRDPDMAAIEQASDSFSSASRSYGQPGEAARAAAAVDYLGGALAASPRWACLSGVAKAQILAARGELRRVLGVAPGTPSQVLVNDLLRAADAVADNDRAAAERALSPPAFTAPGADTLRLLGNLPYMETVTVGTMRVSTEATAGSSDSACFGPT
jgi:hypothetical protein